MLFIVGLTMTACSSKDDFSQDTSPKPIVITANISGMQTRSSADAATLQNTDFANGAKINLYLLGNEISGNYPGVPANPGYLVYTKGESGWTTDTPQLYWTGDGIEAYAIYPERHDDLEDNDHILTLDASWFNVQQWQNNDIYYRMSDLMFANGLYNDKHSPINLTFKHLLSKITVKVEANGVIADSELENQIYSIDLSNITRSVQIGTNFSSVSASGTQNQWVKIVDDWEYKNQYGASGIIPPQQLTAGTRFIDICLNDQVDYWYTVPEDGLNFEGGKEYLFTLKLQKSGLQLGNLTVTNGSRNKSKEMLSNISLNNPTN